MENASKALIIAGAILLSILLITLGIMIFGQAQDTVNNSGMSQAEIEQMLNSDGFGDYADEITDLDTLLQQNYIVYKCIICTFDE